MIEAAVRVYQNKECADDRRLLRRDAARLSSFVGPVVEPSLNRSQSQYQPRKVFLPSQARPDPAKP